MVIHLAGGKHIVVDSKVSLAAYLEAAETTDETVRETRLAAHARHLREHVDRLAGKAYWTALPTAPEFVVLFIPGEAFLAPALEHDPGLLEHAVARRVHIATPTTLVSLLRTAQYAWQQEALSENARAVFEAGRELYERISGLGQHMDRVGKALTGAVAAYNQTVGSLESRVLVSARRLAELGLVEDTQEAPRIVEETPRLLAAPELTASVVPAPAGETAPAQLTSPAPASTVELRTSPPPELTEAAGPEGAPAELFMAHTNGTAT
jgi:DNA recombination protein RmuC